MITTIQLKENVKNELDRLKNQQNRTYEDVILYLVQMREKMKRKQEESELGFRYNFSEFLSHEIVDRSFKFRRTSD